MIYSTIVVVYFKLKSYIVKVLFVWKVIQNWVRIGIAWRGKEQSTVRPEGWPWKFLLQLFFHLMCCVERLPGTSSKIECCSHDTLCYCTWNLVKFSSTVVSVPRYVVCFPVPLCILCEHRTAVKNNDSLCLYMISYTLYMYTSCCLLFIQIHAIVNIIFDLQQVLLFIFLFLEEIFQIKKRGKQQLVLRARDLVFF